MSTIVRGPDGKIKLYCKGADTVILERLAENNTFTEVTLAHLEVGISSHFQPERIERMCRRNTPRKASAPYV